MISHIRIRITNNHVEEGPLTYVRSGSFSKSEGWTDIRVVDVPLDSIKRVELVTEKGKNVSQILSQLVSQYGGNWICFNASYFNERNGELLGQTYRDGEEIYPDVPGKTEGRPQLFYKDSQFGIGLLTSPNGIEMAVCGVSTLSENGKAIDPPHAADKISPNELEPNPRMIAGIKSDGTLGVIIVDGRGAYDKGLTTKEAGILTTYYGYVDSVNLDGGESATLATNNRKLLDELEIDKANKKRQFHVADMSLDFQENIVHHAIAVQFDPDKLLPTYIVDHIPTNTPHNRRPGHALKATTLTIHNTGNPTSTARNERNWLTNPSNDVTASYHIVLDDKITIECLPLDENAWAAGDGTNGEGNRTSIHIEICESGDYPQTIERAVDLVSQMLEERGWGVDRLRRHYDWQRADGYRKICPRLMYDNGSWNSWHQFVERVSKAMEPAPEKKTSFSDVEAGRWSETAIKEVTDAGLMVGYPDGIFKPDRNVTREELAVILNRLK